MLIYVSTVGARKTLGYKGCYFRKRVVLWCRGFFVFVCVWFVIVVGLF